MRVLLCTPYDQGLMIAQGGIAVWARNIVEYGRKAKDDVEVVVVPFDRRTHVNNGMGLFKRFWCGMKEYSSAIRSTKKLLRKEKYDVLHLCTSASVSLLKDIFILRMAKRKGVKTAIHFHFGRIPNVLKEKGWEWKLLKRTIQLADVAITMDMRSYNTLFEARFTNVHYLPNPLSESIMNQVSAEKDKIRHIPNKILFVGHVIPTKGIFELIDACVEIAGVDLHVVGRATPEMISEIKKRANNGNWLVLEGEKPHNEVIREMLSSQLFVLPTYTEGFPNVILEAMACGCAIVTTPVGAIPEMLAIGDENASGLCCAPKDVEGLRKNILIFLENHEKAHVYGERARRRVHELYAVPHVWEQLVNIWKL